MTEETGYLVRKMKQRGYTAISLAEALGVSSRMVYAWRAGQVPTDDAHIRALYRLLGRDLHLFPGGRPPVNKLFEAWWASSERTALAFERLLGTPKGSLANWRSGRTMIPPEMRKAIETISQGAVPYGSWK